MNLHFYKMQGCGNDFLILDFLRDPDPPPFKAREVAYFCDRHYGIGADGFVVLTGSEEHHAKWTFYNCDGSEAEMCGNAARCVVMFLVDKHYPGEKMISFETRVGVVKGKVFPDERMVEITLMPGHRTGLELEELVIKTDDQVYRVFCINTGVPHAVIETTDLKKFPVSKVGRSLVKHPAFGPAGTNVTFFEKDIGQRILSTTFERGVEQETLACGTGAAAAALAYSQLYMMGFPIEVSVPGGTLTLDVSPVSKVLLLRGLAEYVFEVNLAEFPQNFEKPLLFGEDSPK